MRKTLFFLIALLSLSLSANAKLKFGIRGGANISHMSFTRDLLESSNRTGYYVGPTIKFGLPLGFDIDASLLYSQWEAKTDLYYVYGTSIPEDNLVLKRKAVAIPLNLRKGFGMGDKASVFIFAGPQVSFNVGDKTIKEWDYEWSSSDISINLGFGAMLLNHLELKANYNIPCGKTGEFKFSEGYDKTKETIKNKTGGWQIGLAVYF